MESKAQNAEPTKVSKPSKEPEIGHFEEKEKSVDDKILDEIKELKYNALEKNRENIMYLDATKNKLKTLVG